jgi:Flp pilus assembly protein TadB
MLDPSLLGLAFVIGVGLVAIAWFWKYRRRHRQNKLVNAALAAGMDADKVQQLLGRPEAETRRMTSTEGKGFDVTVLLFGMSVVVGAAGVFILANAKSAIHEIEAFLLFIIATILFCASYVLESLQKIRRQLMEKESQESRRA